MAQIHKLSQHVADLIAAGEVVERPASAVKELVENAVDAGAKHVTVEIQSGGVRFIRVTDDGCGMSPDDAETAFLRHATSKIRSERDLGAIGTMGFRGEALAAISAVSRVDLMTRTAGEAAGTALHLEAGTVTERGEAGCPEGTTILVRDLFYNTPARMKFLKRDSVEGSAVQAAVQKQALAHPEVSIRLIRDGQEALHTTGDGSLRAAVYAVYGRAIALDMVPVSTGWEKLKLEGFVTKPSATRGNRSYQQFYVNDRPVVSKLLISALEQAYANELMVGRFPACVLHLTVPPEAVDVNVHPAKTEVKFLSEQDVFDCVRYGVRAALQAGQDRPELKLRPEPQPEAQPQPRSGFYQKMSAEAYRAYTAALAPRETAPSQGARKLYERVLTPQPEQPAPRAAEPQRPVPETIREPEHARVAASETAPAAPEVPTPERAPAPRPEPAAPQPEEPEQAQTALPLPEEQSWRFVGEVMRTYLVVEEGESVLFIDKHAAHERILFEKFRAQDTPIMSQVLLAPVPVQLAANDAALLLERQEMLLQLGYELEDFGGGSLLVRALPAELDAADAAATLEELAEGLRSGARADEKSVRDTLLHTIACKAAIKAGWRTDRAELEALCRQVLSRSDIRHCPHGRPVCIQLTRAQLERRFGRA